MMFKCIINKHIFRDLNKTELGARLRYEMKLPFVPYKGLRFTDNKVNFIIEELDWRNTEQEFYCEALSGSISGLGYDHFTFEELVEEYQSYGWELLGVIQAGKFIEE